MRLEVKCVKCDTSVLVLDVRTTEPISGEPDPADVVRKVKAAGWGLNAQGAVCTEH